MSSRWRPITAKSDASKPLILDLHQTRRGLPHYNYYMYGVDLVLYCTDQSLAVAGSEPMTSSVEHRHFHVLIFTCCIKLVSGPSNWLRQELDAVLFPRAVRCRPGQRSLSRTANMLVSRAFGFAGPSRRAFCRSLSTLASNPSIVSTSSSVAELVPTEVQRKQEPGWPSDWST